jgi:hypothetical protein
MAMGTNFASDTGGTQTATWPRERLPTWQVTTSRGPLWPAVVGLVGAVALLVTLFLVLQQAVEQGELRRQTARAMAEASWRCGDLSTAAARSSCRVELAKAQGLDPRALQKDAELPNLVARAGQ